MMTHSSKKPFECKFIGCAKSYCDARSLRRHLENHHQDYISASAAFDAANSLDGSSFELPSTGNDRSLHGFSADARFNPNSVWTTGYNPLEYVLSNHYTLSLRQELVYTLNTAGSLQLMKNKSEILSLS